MSAGLIALLTTAAAGLAGGLVWRRTNGRMRTPRAVRVPHSLAVPGGQTGPSRPQDEVNHREAGAVPARGTAAPGQRLTGDQIGHALGARATLLQFSSAFCAPCRATRRILADVAGMTEGVAHVEIDAESRLDLVRELNVLRTPTVLVLDGSGGIVRRASGQPRKADVVAAIGAAAGL